MSFANNRNVILTCGVLMLLMLGVIYSWSLFVPALEEEFGWTRSEVSFAFSVSMIMWSVGMLCSGRFQKLFSPRVCFSVGVVLIVAGFSFCSFAQDLIALYFWYGVFCGFGIGLSYNIWITQVLTWFSDRIGFASGLMLMGFGMGSFALGSLASFLIYSPLGWRTAFLIIAGIILLVSLVTMPFLKNFRPSKAEDSALREDKSKHQSPITTITFSEDSLGTKEVLREPSFWLFTLWKILVMGSAAAVIAHASVVMADIGSTVLVATIAVGALSIGNGCGRPLVGLLFDRFGQRRAMVGLPIFGTVIALGLLASYLMEQPIMMIVFMALEGVLYGGYATINVSFIRNTYGQKALSSNMGVSSLTLMPFNIVFPVVAAFFFDSTGSYVYFFIVIPVVTLISLAAGIATDPAIKKSRAKRQVLKK